VAVPPVTLKDIQAARKQLKGVVRNTPLKRSSTLSKLTDSNFYLKLENFQRTGSFKVRGATVKVESLTKEERAKGVVAASAGNHAQGVAYAATRAGIASHIFMPENAPIAKIRATRGYGAAVHLIGQDYQDAYEAAVEFQKESGATFVHAFEDKHIMAGQGTLGLEIAEELPEVDTVIIPIGGGGLISGMATALKEKRPNVRIIGVQAEGASTVADSLDKGRVVPIDKVKTIADGIACRNLGEMAFGCIQRLVDEVVTVTEAEIASAILFLLERTKTTVEGAGAVTLAAAMHHKLDLKGQTVCAVISGGNIDITLLSRIIQRGLVKEGRVGVIATSLRDTPGAVAEFLSRLAEQKANVLNVHHDRHRGGIALNQTYVEVQVETSGTDHLMQVVDSLRADYDDVVVRGS
jgi:threonine dehydratase